VCNKSYSFVLKHKLGNSNKVVDALLSRRVLLLSTTTIEVVGIDSMKVL
jgi:hypothetical protein